MEGKQQFLHLCFILCKATESHNELAAVSGFSESAELRWDRKGLELKDEMLYITSQVKTSQGANNISEQD